MPRGGRGKPVHGMVLLDKPAGLSSNQALQKVRRLFDAAKAGHTGNLDPFATGMLPLCLGEATKTAAFMLDADKTYLATAHLGVATRTGDIEGEEVERKPLPGAGSEELESVLSNFLGDIEQVPPMYSALKHKGKPLYQLARQGKVVERKPRKVHIFDIRLVTWNPPEFVFRVHCSKGTYIRTLAEDIAHRLGSCAHLTALRRLSVSPFAENDMVSLDALEDAAENGILNNRLLPVDAGLKSWPRIAIGASEAGRFSHGNTVTVPGTEPGSVRVYGPGARLLGLGQCRKDGGLEPRRVFNLDGAYDGAEQQA